jgi:hypothetical protein
LKEICDELFKTEIPRTEFYDAPTINAVQEVWTKFVDMEAGRIDRPPLSGPFGMLV